MTSLDVMCCRQVSELPSGPEWIYEMKWRGFRVTAMKSEDGAWLVSRNHLSLGAGFSGIINSLRELPCEQVLMDGQLVALDEHGRACGCPVEMSARGQRPAAVRLVVFDLLEMNGRYLHGLPLWERKLLIGSVLAGGPEGLAAAEVLSGTPRELLAQARTAGQPGIVAKRRDSTYEEGRRTMEWLKCLAPVESVQGEGGCINLLHASELTDVVRMRGDAARRAA